MKEDHNNFLLRLALVSNFPSLPPSPPPPTPGPSPLPLTHLLITITHTVLVVNPSTMDRLPMASELLFNF